MRRYRADKQADLDNDVYGYIIYQGGINSLAEAALVAIQQRWRDVRRAARGRAPLTNMPDGAGTHVLKPNGHPWYYDTALSGGVGGKANTRIGNQTATWQGSHIIAGPKGLMPGEEIFVP